MKITEKNTQALPDAQSSVTQESDRKTTELRQADEAPTWSGLLDLLAGTTRFIGCVLVILLLVALYWVG
jgi:hypothetical protein